MKKISDASPENRYIWHAVVKRFAFASLVYVILWCVVWWNGFVPTVSAELNTFLWFVFLSTPLGRFLLLSKFDVCYDKCSSPMWHGIFTVLSIAPAIAWTYITALSMVQSSSWDVNLALLFAIVGLVSGGINTFSPVMYQAVLFLSVMLLPPAYVIAYLDTEFPKIISIYFLLYFAGMLVVGKVQNTELRESVSNSVVLERASYLDPLTGLANRRHLYKLIDNMPELSSYFTTICVVAVDIDRFKSINDRFGHTAGDECLSRFAKLFESTYSDIGAHCIRMGGEEFLALFFDASFDDVNERTQFLARKTREACFLIENDTISFTISGGIAHAKLNDDTDVKSLIDKADGRLYKAKSCGRDRIEVS